LCDISWPPFPPHSWRSFSLWHFFRECFFFLFDPPSQMSGLFQRFFPCFSGLPPKSEHGPLDIAYCEWTPGYHSYSSQCTSFWFCPFWSCFGGYWGSWSSNCCFLSAFPAQTLSAFSKKSELFHCNGAFLFFLFHWIRFAYGRRLNRSVLPNRKKARPITLPTGICNFHCKAPPISSFWLLIFQ